MSYVKDGLGRYLKTAQGRYMKVPPGVDPCYCCCRTIDVTFSGVELVGHDEDCSYKLGGSANGSLRLPPQPLIGSPDPFSPYRDCCYYGTILVEDWVTYSGPIPFVQAYLSIEMRLCPQPIPSYARMYAQLVGGGFGPGTTSIFSWGFSGTPLVLPAPYLSSQVLENEHTEFCAPFNNGKNGTLTITYPAPTP
jgi:hypothetical protein